MTTLADRGVAALRANYDDLAALVRAFDDADLAIDSGSRDWTVAQVLSHLGSGAEIMRAGVEAAIAGADAPEDGFNNSVWDRWNAMSPREQAHGYLESAGQLMTVMESLDATAREELRVPLGFLPEPATLTILTGMRLNEAAMHSWDVRVAFDQQAGLSTEEADVLISQLSGPLSFMLGFTSKSDTLGLPSAAVRVETTDSSRNLRLTIAPTAALGESSDTEPSDSDTSDNKSSDSDFSDKGDGVLSGPAEAFVRLLTGRYETVRTPDALTLDSDTVTLDQLKRVFPGF